MSNPSIEWGASATEAPTKYTLFREYDNTARQLANLTMIQIDNAMLSIDFGARNKTLLWLTLAAEKGLRVTRFDAALVGDTCLNSTVAKLGTAEQLIVDRDWTTRPNRFGKPTKCKEYWLSGLSLERAKALCEQRLRGKK